MKIKYPIDWDDGDLFERPAKGWLEGVTVEFEDGKSCELCFYDPVRLSQEVSDEIENGKAGFIEKGLIIIPEVTKRNIELAIDQALKEGYFENNT